MTPKQAISSILSLTVHNGIFRETPVLVLAIAVVKETCTHGKHLLATVEGYYFMTRRLRTGLAVTVLLTISLFWLWQYTHPTRKSSVSIVQLLSNPERYDGRAMYVSGYLHVKFEDYGLYLDKESADYMRSENSIWVDFLERPEIRRRKGVAGSTNDVKQMDETFVTLFGVFRADEHGHLGGSPATIAEVSIIIEDSLDDSIPAGGATGTSTPSPHSTEK